MQEPFLALRLRRQANTCCGLTPLARAIAETHAPGISVSSTIRALAASDQNRRSRGGPPDPQRDKGKGKH